MADLVTRIILDNKQFDENIKKSKQEIKEFEQVTQMLGKGMGKMFVALGAATTAMDAFQGIINATQTTGDKFNNTIQASKDSIDEFFYAVNTGNLSSFINGLDDIINKSIEASAALDQLGNTQISYGVFNAKNQSEIADAQYIAKNKFAPMEERNKAFQDWKKALQNENTNMQRVQDEIVNSVTKKVAVALPKGVEANLQNILKAFEVDLLDPTSRDAAKSRAKQGVNAYRAKERDAAKYNYQHYSKDDLQQLAKGYEQHFIVYEMLEKYSDEELTTIAEKVKQYYSLNQALKSTSREYNETANEYNNSMKAMKGFSPVESLEGYKVYGGDTTTKGITTPIKPVIPSGSIADINYQISSLKKEFDIAISNESRFKIQQQLDELEKKKRYIQLDVKYNNPMEGGNDMKGIHNTFKDMGKYKAPSQLNIKKQDNDNIDWANDLNEAFAGAGQSIMSLGDAFSAFSENAALGKSALILGAIGQLVYGFAQASTKTFSPWEWIAFAVSGAATLASVIGQISGYATGGIVGGNSYAGDRNLIRVNSGEMILNKHQQNNLFNAINSGAIGRNNNGGQVHFVIKGKDLVGTLANYNNKVSKVL